MPHVVAQLREEQASVKERFGDALTKEALDAMPYADAVVREALYVCPAAIVGTR